MLCTIGLTHQFQHVTLARSSNRYSHPQKLRRTFVRINAYKFSFSHSEIAFPCLLLILNLLLPFKWSKKSKLNSIYAFRISSALVSVDSHHNWLVYHLFLWEVITWLPRWRVDKRNQAWTIAIKPDENFLLWVFIFLYQHYFCPKGEKTRTQIEYFCVLLFYLRFGKRVSCNVYSKIYSLDLGNWASVLFQQKSCPR